MAIRKLAATGEANPDCLLLWEYLECSICDPQVGVQSGPPLICASLCDRVYDACSNAYFSMDAKIQVSGSCKTLIYLLIIFADFVHFKKQESNKAYNKWRDFCISG